MITKEEFQSKYSGELKAFLQTPCGSVLLDALGSQRPSFAPYKEPHLYSENSGSIRGYELCMRNILVLSSAPTPPAVVEANYGVPPPKTTNPEEKK